MLMSEGPQTCPELKIGHWQLNRNYEGFFNLVFEGQQDARAVDFEADGDLQQFRQGLAHSRLILRLNEEEQETAVPRAAELAAFGAGLHGALIIGIDLPAADRAGELALELPGFVEDASDSDRR